MTKIQIILLIVHVNVPQVPLALRGHKLEEAHLLADELFGKTAELGDDVDSLLLTRLKTEIGDKEGSANMVALLRQIAGELAMSINSPWKHEFAQ